MAQQFAYESTTVTRPPGVDTTEQPDPAELARPSGPAAAVVVAAGLGSFTLGLLSVLTAVSPSVSSALTLSDRVGGRLRRDLGPPGGLVAPGRPAAHAGRECGRSADRAGTPRDLPALLQRSLSARGSREGEQTHMLTGLCVGGKSS